MFKFVLIYGIIKNKRGENFGNNILVIVKGI